MKPAVQYKLLQVPCTRYHACYTRLDKPYYTLHVLCNIYAAGFDDAM